MGRAGATAIINEWNTPREDGCGQAEPLYDVRLVEAVFIRIGPPAVSTILADIEDGMAPREFYREVVVQIHPFPSDELLAVLGHNDDPIAPLSEHFNIMRFAVQVLGEAKERRAMEPLLDMWKRAARPEEPVCPDIREDILSAIAEIGGPGVEEFVTRRFLDESETDALRETAALMLAKLASKSAVDTLLTGQKVEKDSGLRMAIIRALGNSGDARAVEALRPLVDTEEPEGALRAMAALGQLGRADGLAKKAMPYLGDPKLQESAAWALGQMKAKEAMGQLCEILRDEAPGVRMLAAQTLGQIGDPAAAGAIVEALRRALTEQAEAPADERLVFRLVYSIGRLGKVQDAGADEARDALVAVLVDKNRGPMVRMIAAQSLGEIGDRRSADALANSLQGDLAVAVKIAAAGALAKLGGPRAHAALARAKNHFVPTIGRIARAYLAKASAKEEAAKPKKPGKKKS